jgi:hypothetical protein
MMEKYKDREAWVFCKVILHNYLKQTKIIDYHLKP